MIERLPTRAVTRFSLISNKCLKTVICTEERVVRRRYNKDPSCDIVIMCQTLETTYQQTRDIYEERRRAMEELLSSMKDSSTQSDVKLICQLVCNVDILSSGWISRIRTAHGRARRTFPIGNCWKPTRNGKSFRLTSWSPHSRVPLGLLAVRRQSCNSRITRCQPFEAVIRRHCDRTNGKDSGGCARTTIRERTASSQMKWVSERQFR